MPFTLTQVIIITASFGCIGAVSTFIYVFVLIVLKTTKDLWKHPVYKLMFHLGIFATIDIWLQTYYASSWGIWYGPYSRRFVIAGLNMISFGISSFTFALALNRWDVIAKPDRLRFIKGDFVSLFLTVLTYLLATGFFVWQSLPGWGRFMVHLNTQYGPYYLQVREYQNLTEYFIQVDIEQGLMVASIVLYVWCITAIIYKRYTTGTKLANNEKFLFVQTLTPCIVRVIADGISMYITTSDNWFLILTSAMFFFEACHYPFLYLIFNKTIRFYLSRFFFKNTTSVSIMKDVIMQHQQQKAISEQLMSLTQPNGSVVAKPKSTNMKKSYENSQNTEKIQAGELDKPKEKHEENIEANCQIWRTNNHWTGTTKYWPQELRQKELRQLTV
uniref:Uncharacterized protein n=1 Tax=Acrobeloides nanus TaxID=290746 RepID=A0A914CH24_9BILA